VRRLRDSLTDRYFLLFGCAQLAGALFAGHPRVLAVYVIVSAVLILLAALDRRTLSGFDSAGIVATISGPQVIEIGQSVDVMVRVAVRSGRWGVPAVVLCDAPSLETAQAAQTDIRLELVNDGKGLAYVGTLRFKGDILGREALGSIDTLWSSRLGFWARRLPVLFRTTWDFRVIPSRQTPSAQTLRQLIGRQAMLTQGRRQTLKDQLPELLHSIRDYHFPDSLKNIDQKKSAKFGKLKTRVYESLHQHHLIIALDLGRSMAGSLNGSSKLDYYLSAALALAEMAIRSGDCVSFVAFAQDSRFAIRRARSLRAFKPLQEGSSAVRVREEESDYTRLPSVIRSLSGQRSIVVLLSDLSRPSVQDMLVSPMRTICHEHLCLLMSLVDQELGLERRIEALDPDQLESYNRLLHAYALQEAVGAFREKVGRAGGGVVLAPDHEWLSSCVRLYSVLRDSIRI